MQRLHLQSKIAREILFMEAEVYLFLYASANVQGKYCPT